MAATNEGSNMDRPADAGGTTATQQLKSQVGETTDQLRHAKDDAVQQAGDALKQAAAAGQQAKEQLGQQAAEAARMLRERGTSLLADGKEQVATTLEGIGNALGDAGRRLEDEHDPAIARYIHGAADQVHVLADYLKNKPAESLMGDLADAARRRPEYFVGGMFLVGLALARVAKSTASTGRSAPTSRGGYSGGGYGGGYGAGYGGPTMSNPSAAGYYGGTRYAEGERYDDRGSDFPTARDVPSALPEPGRDAATGGHEVTNVYAIAGTAGTGPAGTPALAGGASGDATRSENPGPSTGGASTTASF